MYDKVEIIKTLMILSKILDIPFYWKEEPEREPKRLQAFWWRLHSPAEMILYGSTDLWRVSILKYQLWSHFPWLTSIKSVGRWCARQCRVIRIGRRAGECRTIDIQVSSLLRLVMMTIRKCYIVLVLFRFCFEFTALDLTKGSYFCYD